MLVIPKEYLKYIGGKGVLGLIESLLGVIETKRGLRENHKVLLSGTREIAD